MFILASEYFLRLFCFIFKKSNRFGGIANFICGARSFKTKSFRSALTSSALSCVSSVCSSSLLSGIKLISILTR